MSEMMAAGEAREMRHEARDNLWPGRVTQVVDPQYFWMQIGSREGLNQFDALQRDLHKFGVSYNWQHVEDSQQLEPEQRVLVDTGENSGGAEISRFKRGVITRVAGEDFVDVFYVDFGTNELTSGDKICMDFPSAFAAWPTQAIRCSLAGIQPISKNWTSRGTKTFQKATGAALIHVLIVGVQPGYYEVALYPSGEETARSVAHHLLEEDVAMPIEGKEVPEFVKDVPAFVAMISQGYSEQVQSSGEGQTAHVSQNSQNNSTSTALSSTALSSSPQSSKPQSEKYIPPGLKRDLTPPRGIVATDTAPRASHGVTAAQRSNHPEYTTLPSSANHSQSQSNFGKTSHKGLKLNTDLKHKAPVVDFFPFQNVSTYPPSPVSPQKSPVKPVAGPGSGYSAETPDEARYDHLGHSRDQAKQGQEHVPQYRDSVPYEKSYSSRSPSKYHPSDGYADYPPVSPYYDTDTHTDMNYARSPGRYVEASPSRDVPTDGYGSPGKSSSGHHSRNTERFHGHGDGESGMQRKPLQNIHRFAAKFNNLPDENGKYHGNMDSGKDFSVAHKTGLVGLNASKENAVNSFEPSYLQSSLEKQSMYQGSAKNVANIEASVYKTSYTKSPEKYDGSRSKTSPSKSPQVRDYTVGGSSIPFYPPKTVVGDVGSRGSRQITLTPPSFYEQPASQNNGNSKANNSMFTGSTYQDTSEYNGDAFYHHHHHPSNSQAGPSFTTTSSSIRSASYDTNQSTGRVPYQYNNYNSPSATNSNMNKNNSKLADSEYYPGKHKSGGSSYRSGNAYDSHSDPVDDRTIGPSSSASHRFSHNNNATVNHTDGGYYSTNHNSAAAKLNMNVQNAQAYSHARGYGYERQKSSPDSAQIAGFNLGDLEHTQETSTDQLKQRIHAKKLQVLQEEAGDIAAEIRENAVLTEISRFGGKSEDVQEYSAQVDSTDVFQEISKEIDFTIRQPQKEYDELRMSSAKRTRAAPDISEPVRLESIPSSYISNIDFPTAVKEALDFSQSGDVDMVNLKNLLNDVMESVSRAHAESQLYDVLLLLLARAIQDYSQYHDVIMDAIDTLSGHVEMKESLCRALKRQQELNVRVPQSKSVSTTHQAFAQVLGHVYMHSISWIESNAAIQDSILVTVEKWVVFNNRVTQMGQKDKEHLFLDCFCAFMEIASLQLKKQHEGFCDRVQAEIKWKLLNEDVSREIRERLLEILLDQFAAPASREQTDAHTQTLNRTMIPSSCQVKPDMFTCDKGTETDSDWLEMLLDEFGAEETSSPGTKDPHVSLRPGGKTMNSYSEQPDYYSPGRSISSSDQCNSSYATRGSASFNNTTTSVGDDSVYDTANESSMSEYAGIDHAKDGAAFTENNIGCGDQASSVDRTVQRVSVRKVSDKEASGSGSQTAVGEVGTWSKGARGKERNGISESSFVPKSPNKTATRSVTGTKSAQGKSIVDWFDYEPEPQPGVCGTTVTVKHDKSAESKTNKSKVSTEKTGGKSLPKSTASDIKTSTDSSVTSNKKSKKNKKSSQTAEKKDNASNVKHEVAHETVVKVNDDAVGSVANVVGSKNDELLEDEEIDWWGEEEEIKPSLMYSQAPGSLGLFIDTGPDVIIESESEHVAADAADADNVVDEDEGGQVGISDAEAVRSDPNLTDDAAEIRSPIIDQPSLNQTFENSSPVESKHMQSTEEEMILDEALRKIDDEYAFDSDDDEDDADFYNFGSDVEDVSVSKDIGATGQQTNTVNTGYDDNFPASDLMVPLRNTSDVINGGANVDNLAVDAAESVVDNEYDHSFPRTNLGDYIHPVEVECEPPAPMARWVPGKRMCLKCRDENHKTENCPEGALLLH